MALFNKKSAAPQQKSADFALLPNHVGIIMDGNGRWAKKRGLPRSAGHKAGLRCSALFLRLAGVSAFLM